MTGNCGEFGLALGIFLQSRLESVLFPSKLAPGWLSRGRGIGGSNRLRFALLTIAHAAAFGRNAKEIRQRITISNAMRKQGLEQEWDGLAVAKMVRMKKGRSARANRPRNKFELLLAVLGFDFPDDLVHADDLAVKRAGDQRGLFHLAGLCIRNRDSINLQRAAKRALVVGFCFD